MLRTALLLSRAGEGPPRTTLITSASPHEGEDHSFGASRRRLGRYRESALPID